MFKRLMVLMNGLLVASLLVAWVVPEAEGAVRRYRSIESTHYYGDGSVSDQLFGVSWVGGEYVASCKMQGLVFCDPVVNPFCSMATDAALLGETDFVSLEMDFTDGSATTTAELSTAAGQKICNDVFGTISGIEDEDLLYPQDWATIFDKFWPQDENNDIDTPDFFAQTTYESVSGETQVLQELCNKPETADAEGEITAECYETTFKVPCCGGSNTLTVQIEGQGTVESEPAGVNCVNNIGDCTKTYDGTTGSPVYDTCPDVVLTATPECDPYGSCYGFTGWSGGGCSGTVPSCTVTTQGNPTVTAAFEASYHTLTVEVDGDGTKDRAWIFKPRSDFDIPSEFYCYGTCYKQFEPGTTVVIKRKGGTFGEWGGDVCSGVPNSVDTCEIVMDGSKTVTANFIN